MERMRLVCRELQQHPILWDKSRPDYRLEYIKEDCRRQISQSMLSEHSVHLSTVQIKNKVKQMLTETRKYWTEFYKVVSGDPGNKKPAVGRWYFAE